MKHASRLEALPSYPFARWDDQVAAVRQKGRDVIRLDIGNPDMPPPDEIIETLCHSVHRPDRHGYPGYRGLRSLREAIAAHYERRFGVTLDPETEVVPLIGSKEGIINLALACLDPGDVALVPDPGYAPYTRGTILAGAEVYSFPLLPDRNFLPDLEAIPSTVADRATLLWLNYPNNPTGATADLNFLAQAVDYARRHDLLLCHDAPYCDVTYNGYTAPSVLQIDGASEVAVEFNSLSKTVNMAGWRLGMAVGNPEAMAALARVKSNMDSGIFHPLQEAAVQALSIDPAWLAERNMVYQERLEILLNGIKSIGLSVWQPEGIDATLYLWAPIPDPGFFKMDAADWSSETFALTLLERTGVSLAPGTFFGPSGEGYVRISVTAPTERIRGAVERIQAQFS